MISKHLDKNNLHHAYLLEGEHELITPEIFEFLESIKFPTAGNPDFYEIKRDSFNIEDARSLKSLQSNKAFTSGKKIFLISANSFLLEAQNSLLKMFEEPIEQTTFFVIVPDANALLRTLVSRFYLIKGEKNSTDSTAQKFLGMTPAARIAFLKDFLQEPEGNEEGEVVESLRAKSLKFLNSLESRMQDKIPKNSSGVAAFEHMFKVRQFLRMPGSSAKTLMESLALVIPKI